MILRGRDIQALLGAMLIQQFVPFVRTTPPNLTAEEIEAARSAREKILAAKRMLRPPEPRGVSDWHQMLEDNGEVTFSSQEILVLVRVVDACLNELTHDVELSTQAGPGVGLDALRAIRARL